MRCLPELQARRDKDVTDGLPPTFLDCDTCLVTATETERASLHCGYLPQAEWLDDLRPFPECATCPGYSTRLPEVAEAARALSWSKRGGLVPLYGTRELPACAVDAVDILDAAANKVERDAIRAQRERVDGS